MKFEKPQCLTGTIEGTIYRFSTKSTFNGAVYVMASSDLAREFEKALMGEPVPRKGLLEPKKKKARKKKEEEEIEEELVGPEDVEGRTNVFDVIFVISYAINGFDTAVSTRIVSNVPREIACQFMKTFESTFSKMRSDIEAERRFTNLVLRSNAEDVFMILESYPSEIKVKPQL